MNSLSWRPPTQHSKEQWIHAMFHYKLQCFITSLTGSEQKIKKAYNQSLSNLKQVFLSQTQSRVVLRYWIAIGSGSLPAPSPGDRDHTIPFDNGKYGEWPRGAQVEWFSTRGQGS